MCTIQSLLPRGKLRLPVFGPIQEWRDFSFVLQHRNNHCHPYIDSTTVLSDRIGVVPSPRVAINGLH